MMTSEAFEAHNKLMNKAVQELMKVHRLSERDAASIMLTVASVVGLTPLVRVTATKS